MYTIHKEWLPEMLHHCVITICYLILHFQRQTPSMSTELGEIFNIHVKGHSDYIMHSGQNRGAMIIVTRETGLIAPAKKNIYNANNNEVVSQKNRSQIHRKFA